MAPDGRTLWVANKEDGTATVIDTATELPSGTPVTIAPALEELAIAPDGASAYATAEGSTHLAVIDTAARTLLASPDLGGLSPDAIAFLPDQGPRAAFAPLARARPGVPLGLDASASSDPDGSVTGYQWSFGDGGSGEGGPRAEHAYRAPGTYQLTLTVADAEGCSTALIYTGQTAYCNGGPAASVTEPVVVAFPGVRVRCPARARPHRCRVRLQVLSRKPGKGRKGRRRAKAESAVTTLRLRAGAAAIASLRPKAAYRRRLAGARKLLVRRSVRIAGKTTTSYPRLRVLR